MLHRSVRRVVTSIAIVALGVAALGACTPGSQGQSPNSGSDVKVAAKGNAAVQKIDLSKPIASQDVTVPGADGDKVTVGVLSLQVQGKLAILNLVLTPKFTSVSAKDDISIYDMLGSHGLYPTLIDRDNLKVYSGVSSFKTDESTKTVNGKPIYAWVAFAAPEDDQTAFDVRINDNWPMFTNVPVSK